MVLRLIRDFSKDTRAGIAVMTVLLMPIVLILMIFAYDMGRYFMMTRFVSTAAQQTVEWMANRGTFAGEIPNTIAKQGFDSRMGGNLASSSSGGTLSGGSLTSTVLTFTHDPVTRMNRLVMRANYNSALRNLLGQPTLTYPIAAVASVKLQPVFVSIVFSSGEMRSEGDFIYGNQKPAFPNDSTDRTYNQGVSWANSYYKQVIGQTVGTRSTPTHNFYMTTALVKELTHKFQYRQLYMNIIPVSATINLNPLDASASPRGSREGKLPPWIYYDTGLEIDNTSNASPTEAYCITNRSFPSGIGTGSWYRDYYEVHGSEINTTIPVTGRYFTHDSLLMDSTFTYSVNEGNSVHSNPDALKTRGYPYSPLVGGKCPATNSTPALATFQQVTTPDYTANAQAVANPTENQIFWDYMRNFIDPDLARDYAIWGSPNIAFGLQIAYENIGHVQATGQINNNTGNTYDPNSEFLVYVVSDQIGAVKNAAGAYVTKTAFTATNRVNRWTGYPRCVGITDPAAQQSTSGCIFTSLDTAGSVQVNQLPSNNTAGPTEVPFQFSHYWWDNSYNVTNQSCFESDIYIYDTCDIIYSSASNKVVHHFYNIINYSINLKYNKTLTYNFPKPKAFFIDTGSGKTDDQCLYSNTTFPYVYLFLTNTAQFQYDAIHYTNRRYCFAYHNLIGKQYLLGALLKKDGGISALNVSSLQFAGSDSWVDDPTHSISGFSLIIAKQVTAMQFNDIVGSYFPMQYYATPKLQINSNPLAASEPYVTLNNKTNAAAIAKFAVKASLGAPSIVSPY